MLGYCDTDETSKATLHKEYVTCINWRPAKGWDEVSAKLFADFSEIAKKSESKRRKETPIWSGLLQYFPLACAAVARLSFKANEKHNPGEPMHWAREKSNDHEDCIIRHSMNPAEIDPEFGELHAVARAWRAMAALELLEEKRLGKQPPAA